ncbi:MAG: ribonuclease P protein component [Nitrospirae bacterium RIFCSPLOWO2_02_FULL_62_14]|nr:MAG: ribonuclease P protein component [Nitrospirae bacterium RIFCSPLOWO2_02_FULL_62_14]OGW70070.1 MAG: ribonuclease P protein component [Nitrospirae bacterium RIFCSPLOWO2_01_FULL_62_17]
MARLSEDRSFFLKKSGDIERVKKTGRRLPTPLFNLMSCRSDMPHARVGVIVGKRLGGAVVRNRAKRLFRELARRVRGRLVPGRDLLIFPRHGALEAAPLVLQEAWLAALRQQALMRSSEEA